MKTLQRFARSPWTKAIPWIALAAYGATLARDGRAKAPEASTPAAYAAAEPGRGRGARKVGQITRRGWKDIAWRVYQEVGKDRLPIVAGGVTFYTLLALFPGLGAFVALYGLVAEVSDVAEQIGRLRLILPPDVVDLVGDQMLRIATAREASLTLTFLGSFLFAIWSAGAGINALFDGMNIAYGEAEERSWIRRKGVTLGFTVGLIVMVTALTILLVALPLSLREYGLAPSEAWWIPFSWVAALALVIAFFAALYRYGPSRAHAQWSWVWPGAVAAAVGWLVGSIGFSIYVGRFANYADAYGPLGAVIAFMVWIWFSALVILLGAELNAEIEHQTAIDTTTGPPMPLGQRGAAMADTVGKPFKGFSFLKKKPEKKVWSTLRKTAPP